MTSVLTRRTVLKTAALASTAIAAPLVRSAFAAGKLSCGFWDHWVPTATAPLEQLCREWAAKEKVDITVDFITSNGDKDLLTMAAEAPAKSGHDVLQFTSWYATGQAENLEPVDDVVGAIIAQNGNPIKAAEYLGKSNGHWIAVPTGYGSTLSPPCARIDLMKQFTGVDVTKMYPAGAPPDQQLADNWTWAFFLDAAEKCFKGGYPFGMPMSAAPDAVNWVGTIFAAHGVQLVDVEGNITVKSDATRQVLEWFQKAVPLFPPTVFAWNDASNNKALISGESTFIMNSPSAWAVAKRDAPKVAEQLWTFQPPKGPNGRYDTGINRFWGSGISRPINRRRKACWPFCRRALRSKSWLMPAKAMMFRSFRSSMTLPSGRKRSRPRGRSTTFRRGRTRSFRSRVTRRRPRSVSRCIRRARCAK